MSDYAMNHEKFVDVLLSQLQFFGTLSSLEVNSINYFFKKAQRLTQSNFDKCLGVPNEFNLFQTHHCIVFLYHLARIIFEEDRNSPLCEKIYLLNRMLNSIDLFYKIDMPEHFMVGHGLGTVFSRAHYGNYFVIFQNVTIGTQDGKYPVIGEKVVIYPNCVVAGNTSIGNNCVVGAGTKLINKTIPDNSIVFEEGNKLIFKDNYRNEINKYFNLVS